MKSMSQVQNLAMTASVCITLISTEKAWTFLPLTRHTRAGWKVHRLTKILAWNVNKKRFIFQYSPLCSSHTSFISFVVFGSHWSKKISSADMTLSNWFFSLWTFQPNIISNHTKFEFPKNVRKKLMNYYYPQKTRIIILNL